MVFWDKIIRADDNKRLAISNLKGKYSVTDVQDKLPGTLAVIKLYWNTVSYVGYLFDTHKGEVSVKIPNVGEKFVHPE